MTDKVLHTNAVIVGAGPAGFAVSAFLSKAGIRHIIIDKAAFPRDKICGDAVSGKSIYVIRSISEAWLRELTTDVPELLPTAGLSFFAPNGACLSVPYSKNSAGDMPGFTVTRFFFDDLLFRRLDSEFATILTPAILHSAERRDGRWKINIETGGRIVQVTTRIIVGADGDKSIVRKKLGMSEATSKTSAVGLRAYYSGISGLEKQQIELHFLPELAPGYFWIFPLPDGRANVGAGMLSQEVRNRKINLRELMLHAIANNPSLKDRFANARLEGKILGWGLPMGTKKQALSGDGFLLTGDAAHLIDPFSGEGIGNALYSGMLAARGIEQALIAQNYSAAFLKEHYDDPVYKRLWGELRTSVILQRLCRYPWLVNFMIAKAGKSPTLKAVISGMFTDLDLRKKLRQPAFYLKMLLNR